MQINIIDTVEKCCHTIIPIDMLAEMGFPDDVVMGPLSLPQLCQMFAQFHGMYNSASKRAGKLMEKSVAAPSSTNPKKKLRKVV